MVEVCYWMLVPAAQAGMLIGKGGDVIRRIRDESRATVKLSDHDSGASQRPAALHSPHACLVKHGLPAPDCCRRRSCGPQGGPAAASATRRSQIHAHASGAAGWGPASVPGLLGLRRRRAHRLHRGPGAGGLPRARPRRPVLLQHVPCVRGAARRPAPARARHPGTPRGGLPACAARAAAVCLRSQTERECWSPCGVCPGGSAWHGTLPWTAGTGPLQPCGRRGRQGQPDSSASGSWQGP